MRQVCYDVAQKYNDLYEEVRRGPVAKRGLTERGADLVQLVEGVRHALEVGTLRAGERLPMVRALMR